MDLRLMSLSHLCVVLFVFVLWLCSCLSQTVSVVSVVQITLNSHVRNLIEVIRFTLCLTSLPVRLLVRLVVLPPCLDRSYVLVTNINSFYVVSHSRPYTAC